MKPKPQEKTQAAQPGLLHPVVMEWEYSRNQLRHSARDSGLYKFKGDFYELFEIRSNRNPYQIRKSSDTHRLLHKGKLVAENKSIKVLKETAAKLHNDKFTDPMTNKERKSYASTMGKLW